MELDPWNASTCIINYINHDDPSHLPQEVQLNCSGNGKKEQAVEPQVQNDSKRVTEPHGGAQKHKQVQELEQSIPCNKGKLKPHTKGK